MNPSPPLILVRATGIGVAIVVAAFVWNVWGRTHLGGPFIPFEVAVLVALVVMILIMLSIGWAYRLKRLRKDGQT